MLSTRDKARIQFCYSVANEIITQAKRYDMTPTQLLEGIGTCFDNKMKCIEKSNSGQTSDMLDALAYSMRMPCSTYHIYAEGKWEPSYNYPELDKIIYSGNRTIVFWKDGTKTIVKCAKEQEFDEYSGFVAAFAKKAFGSTSHIKKLISRLSVNKNKLSKDNTDGDI